MTQFEHAGQQCRLAALLFQHRKEILAPPGRAAMRIEKQARGVLRLEALAVVYRQLVRPPLDALGAAQIELAGRVVAGMAGHAILAEERLNIATVGNRFCRQQRTDKQRASAEHCAIRHEPIPQVTVAVSVTVA
ncbi:hypothetical protein D3C80_1440260 [compost metagenome]